VGLAEGASLYQRDVTAAAVAVGVREPRRHSHRGLPRAAWHGLRAPHVQRRPACAGAYGCGLWRRSVSVLRQPFPHHPTQLRPEEPTWRRNLILLDQLQSLAEAEGAGAQGGRGEGTLWYDDAEEEQEGAGGPRAALHRPSPLPPRCVASSRRVLSNT